VACCSAFQIDQLWDEVKVDVLVPLEAALPHFNAAAAAKVASKYYAVYS
jgi:RNAse (barnase) inhibitor barstar